MKVLALSREPLTRSIRTTLRLAGSRSRQRPTPQPDDSDGPLVLQPRGEHVAAGLGCGIRQRFRTRVAGPGGIYRRAVKSDELSAASMPRYIPKNDA